MSYILDALRRADAERLRGQVPGLHSHSPAATPRATRRSWAPRAGLIGLGVGAIGVLAALWGWRHGVDHDAAPAVSLGTAAPAATPTPPTALPGPPTLPTTPTLSGKATSGSSPAPVALPLPPARTTPLPRVERPVAVAESARPRSSAISTSPAAEPPVKSVDSSGAASAPPRLYRVDELPEELRRQLPALAIGGSAYSANPASRFVIVNGQLVHEGDTLAPGLTLEQIRLKSAVLAFKGYRYGISF